MSDLKRTCVACGAWTTSVGIAYRDGEPCPTCSLPNDAAVAIETARDRAVNDDLIQRCIEAEKRAVKAEAAAYRLKILLRDMKTLLEPYKDIDD